MEDVRFAIQNMQQTIRSELPLLDLDCLDCALALRICALHRRIGCGRFLVNGDRQSLYEGLFRSAYTYLYFLRTLQGRGEVGTVARSHSPPLTDALAIGQLKLARQIDLLLPHRYSAGRVGDGDFNWHFAFHSLCLGRIDGSALHVLAEGILATRSEFLAPRRKVLASIAARDGNVFSEALGELTQAWRGLIEEQHNSGHDDHDAALTESKLFLEGAALLRAASDRGLAVEASYPFIPSELGGEPPASLGTNG